MSWEALGMCAMATIQSPLRLRSHTALSASSGYTFSWKLVGLNVTGNHETQLLMLMSKKPVLFSRCHLRFCLGMQTRFAAALWQTFWFCLFNVMKPHYTASWWFNIVRRTHSNFTLTLSLHTNMSVLLNAIVTRTHCVHISVCKLKYVHILKAAFGSSIQWPFKKIQSFFGCFHWFNFSNRRCCDFPLYC